MEQRNSVSRCSATMTLKQEHSHYYERKGFSQVQMEAEDYDYHDHRCSELYLQKSLRVREAVNMRSGPIYGVINDFIRTYR
jgi:hypothetical protein